MNTKDYSDPTQNPYANDPVALEAIEFLFNKLSPHNPKITRAVIWEWYIENRPLVDTENARLAAEGHDVVGLEPKFREFADNLNGE